MNDSSQPFARFGAKATKKRAHFQLSIRFFALAPRTAERRAAFFQKSARAKPVVLFKDRMVSNCLIELKAPGHYIMTGVKKRTAQTHLP